MARRPPDEKKKQLMYMQHHLANECTYLAWIRTGISIVGVGYLATSLHFTMGSTRNQFVDVFTIALDIFGLVIIFTSTQNYKKKRQQIINETFYPSNIHITPISSMLAVVIVMVIIYFFMIM